MSASTDNFQRSNYPSKVIIWAWAHAQTLIESKALRQGGGHNREHEPQIVTASPVVTASPTNHTHKQALLSSTPRPVSVLLSCIVEGSCWFDSRNKMRIISITLGPNRYGISGAVPIISSKEIPIFVIYRLIFCIYNIYWMCCQVLVTKTCNGGRICYILTNFILSLSARNRRDEHLKKCLLINCREN